MLCRVNKTYLEPSAFLHKQSKNWLWKGGGQTSKIAHLAYVTAENITARSREDHSATVRFLRPEDGKDA
jgi:hypothetical protein